MLSKQPFGRIKVLISGCGKGGPQMWYHQNALSMRLSGSHTTSSTFNCGIRANAMRTRRWAQRLGCLKPFKLFWRIHWELNFSTSDAKGKSRSLWKKKSSSSPKRLNSMSPNCCSHRPRDVVPHVSIPAMMKSSWKRDQCDNSATSSCTSEGTGNGRGDLRTFIKYP